MSKKGLTLEIKEKVFQRAGGCCEYCKSPKKYCPDPFHTEHILPLIAGGKTILENLAYACGGCNWLKRILTAALDPKSKTLAPLFHPRQHKWSEHFAWSSDFLEIVGLTPTGRATVQALSLNRPEVVNLRRIVIPTGEHPPAED